VPRIDLATLDEGTPIVRVYLALKLDEATRVERALDGAGVEYGIEVEPIVQPDGLGLRTERNAAGFWIEEGALDLAEAALRSSGLLAGLVMR
jgi:hypothetical protein